MIDADLAERNEDFVVVFLLEAIGFFGDGFDGKILVVSEVGEGVDGLGWLWLR